MRHAALLGLILWGCSPTFDPPDSPPSPRRIQRGSWGGLKVQYQPAKMSDDR